MRAIHETPEINDNTDVYMRKNNWLQIPVPMYFKEKIGINRYHLGITGGGGVQFDIVKKYALFFELRYAYPINWVIRFPADKLNFGNNSFTFNSGLLF